MNKLVGVLVGSIMLLLMAMPGAADDIDIYRPASDGPPARIMLALDLLAPTAELTRAKLRAELIDLAATLAGPGAGRRVELGLMAWPAEDCTAGATGSSAAAASTSVGPCSGGAYLVQGFTDIRSADGLDQLLATLAALSISASPDPGVGHSFSIADSYLELTRYLSGQTTGTRPIGQSESCTSVSMVNLLGGLPGPAGANARAAIAAPVNQGGLNLDLEPGTDGDSALLAALAGGDRRDLGALPVIRSFVLAPAIDPVHNALALAGGTGRAWSLAQPHNILAALDAVFRPAIGRSESLVAATMVPRSEADSALEGDIFFALFQPLPGPAWQGNVKKLKVVAAGEPGGASGDLRRARVVQAPLTDTPPAAMSPRDGGILADALTFWTDPAGHDVLAFDARFGEVAGRDGRAVSRGGAGQQVPGFLGAGPGARNGAAGARQLFTLDPAQPADLLALDATPATAALLASLLDPGGSLSLPEQLALLGWLRGQDAFDEDGDADIEEARGWLLADVLHSRPLAINYGARPDTAYSAENPDIRLFFGSNDGLFHMLRNTLPGSAGAESGVEAWAFIPPALLARQARLARAASGRRLPQHYGMDGEPVAFIHDSDDDGNIEPDEGDRVWVFIGQRRGGSSLFAFDMSNPDQPRLMWTLDNATPGFEQLGLTFSTPQVSLLDLGAAAPNPVLVFGGGYHGGWEGGRRRGKDAGSGPDPLGNAVYVVDAASGELIWRALGPGALDLPVTGPGVLAVPELIHSIPSAVTVIDGDRNGVDDRAYVGDSGGNVWRIDLTEHRYRVPGTAVTDPRNWRISLLAALGGAGANDRRFFHAPDVVQSRDATGEYDGVVILSGNRAAPSASAVRNFAYLLKDRAIGSAPPTSGTDPAPGALAQAALADVSAICDAGVPTACSDPDLSTGWRLALPASGEKGLSTPLVSNGSVFFTSYVPAESPACGASTGSGRVYAVRLANGAPALPQLAGGVKVAADSARFRPIGPGLHGDVVPYAGGGGGNNSADPGAGAGSSGRDSSADILVPGAGIDGSPVYHVPGRTHWRTYWRQEEVGGF